MLPTPENRWTWTLVERLASDIDQAHRLLERFEVALHEAGWEGRDLFHVRTASEEGLVNAIEHGNKRDPKKFVDVVFRVSPEVCFVQITDQGSGFCRRALKDCTADENLDTPRGRGVWLIEQLMSDSEYNERGNQLTMVRKRNDPKLAIVDD
jgi:serine/threonine-protein kinase RsbW